MTRAAYEAVAELAGIAAGTAVLDVGCGTGAFCELAAARGAVVHGLDAEPDAIAAAQRRVPDADLQLGLMEALPWADATFDVVTGFNAFQYALDVDLALREAGRVARPGAAIAICKWGPPADNEFFGFLLALGAGGVRGDQLPATDPVDDALGRVRIDVVATGEVPAPIELDDDAALAAALSNAGIADAWGDELPRERIAAAAAPYRQAGGGYRFGNRLRYRIARA